MTEAQTIADLAVANDASEDLSADNLVALPEGYKIHDLVALVGTPRRAKAAVAVRDVESFRRYLSRFGLTSGQLTDEQTDGRPSNPSVAVFADPEAGTFKAVLDFHTADGNAHGEHTCTLQLTQTEAWKAWTKKDRAQMSQIDLASFIEERIEDVAVPAGAKLLEAVKHVQATRSAEFKSKVNLDNGDLVFAFKSDTQAVGEVTMPERFTLGVRLFEGTEPYRVEARLRYRVSDEGALTLWYQLLNVEAVTKAVADEALGAVEAVVGAANVFVGSLR